MQRLVIGVPERIVGEVVLRHGSIISRIIVAVSTTSPSNMRAVNTGPERHHVLVHHAAKECIAPCIQN